MTSAFPWALIVLATLLLAAALYAFWQSLRAAFGLSDFVEVESEGDEDERRSLLQQKDALLENLQDLAFEHEAGKISDDDFRMLEARLRAQAKAVLRKLDEDVAPFREKAEALVAKHLAAVAVDVPAQPSAPPGKTSEEKGGETKPSAREPSHVSVSIGFDVAAGSGSASSTGATDRAACAACGTANDVDAVFCKKCGARLSADPGEGGSEEAGR